MTSPNRAPTKRQLRDENRQLRQPLETKEQELCDLIAVHQRQLGELMEMKAVQSEQIQLLSDEIKRLKKLPKRPRFKPSKMLDPVSPEASKKSSKGDKKKSAGGGRKKYRARARKVKVVLKVLEVPEGSHRRGYKDYTVQDLELRPSVICYRRERWRTPCGQYLTAPLPEHVQGHCGANLRRLVIALYYQGQSSVERITALLNDWDVTIDKTTVGRILRQDMQILVQESRQVRDAGIAGAQWLHVDDTGARHQHKNGYCTVIGNDLFTFFASGESKSRLNFLRLLSGDEPNYVLNAAAFDYMRTRKLSKSDIARLEHQPPRRFDSESEFKVLLDELGFSQRQVKSPPV